MSFGIKLFLTSMIVIAPALGVSRYQPIVPDPVTEPPAVEEPKGPSADLPIRSLLPVEPMNPEPPRSILPVEPIVEEPRPMPNLPRQVERRARNVLPVEPGRSFFPVEPIPEPSWDYPRQPVENILGPGHSNIDRDDANSTEYNPRAVPVPRSSEMPNLPRQVERRVRNVVVPEPVPAGPRRGNLPVGRGVVAPEPAGRQYEPRPVEPLPRRRVYKPGSDPVMQSRDGVSGSAANRPIVPIILPNPIAAGSARIEFQAAGVVGQMVRVELIDAMGRVVSVSEQPGRRDGSYELDLGRLSNGTYLLRMSAPGVSASHKLVLQR